MIKNLTCIECPKGCALAVEVEKGRVINVSGNMCPKGKGYALSEIENPVRVLTSTVLLEGAVLKMLPVKTDRPIPKKVLLEAMREIKKVKVSRTVRIGDVILENLLGLGVNLIAARESPAGHE